MGPGWESEATPGTEFERSLIRIPTFSRDALTGELQVTSLKQMPEERGLDWESELNWTLKEPLDRIHQCLNIQTTQKPTLETHMLMLTNVTLIKSI